ncbi:hypothetical protein [Thermofilum pendens]|uniref:Uncharacterized protein n=1 Tax=Thermofilum pendens (strain DSM 2475 / Hrk 5) TaxID=368408 RepID=A1S0C1_THEPD|nr:hypothetical protein [Thermofilum pendens]ABL78901.1 hypothetical protein Tpen_1504 [Thermofilum pendens Hrk 5]
MARRMALRKLLGYLEKCELISDEELMEIEDRLSRGEDVLEMGIRVLGYDEKKEDYVVEVEDLEGLLSENGYNPDYVRYQEE